MNFCEKTQIENVFQRIFFSGGAGLRAAMGLAEGGQRTAVITKLSPHGRTPLPRRAESMLPLGI
jgi:hypothetical protein